MAVSGKAFVISLDCVNAELLDGWTATGRLPNLARLRKRGVARRLTCKSVSIEADWPGEKPRCHGHLRRSNPRQQHRWRAAGNYEKKQ